MTIMHNLVHRSNPILKDISLKVLKNTQLRNEISKVLSEKIQEYKGIGLAAPQLGIPVRAIIIGFGENPQVMFNPEIIEFGPDSSLMSEGCLSFPQMKLKVRRSTYVDVKWENLFGEEKSMRFVNLTAQILQHEIGHLDGVLFTDLVSRYKIDKEVKRLGWKSLYLDRD
jgi:peptide deformylase